MKVRIKKLVPEAVLPAYAHPTDVGMDLTAVRVERLKGIVTYHTGLAFEIPEGYAGFIFPRSSNYRTNLLLTNSVGIVDPHYRGEVCVKFRETGSPSPDRYRAGDRVAQMVILPFPKVEWEETGELSRTDRGANGYGSTGK